MKFNVRITTRNTRACGWTYGPEGAQRPHEAFQEILAEVTTRGEWYSLAVGADRLVNDAGDTIDRPQSVAMIRISEIEMVEVAPYDPAVQG